MQQYTSNRFSILSLPEPIIDVESNGEYNQSPLRRTFSNAETTLEKKKHRHSIAIIQTDSVIVPVPDDNTGDEEYRRYKADTTIISKWLRDTAIKCGIQPDDKLLICIPPSSSSSQDKSQNKKSEYQLPMKSFVPLAEHIASPENNVKIDEKILSILERAVRLRQKTTEAYRQEGKSSDMEDQKHCHFVKVLKDVLNVLESSINAKQRLMPFFLNTSRKL